MIKNIVIQIVMMLNWRNAKSNLENHYDLRKTKVGLMKLIFIDGFNGILDTL